MLEATPKANTHNLGNMVSKISTAPGGAINASFTTVSSNKAYFTFGSHCTVFVYKLSNFQLCESLCQGESKVSQVRLSNKNLDQLAILYENGNLCLFDLLERKVTKEIQLNKDKKSLSFGSMDFSPDGELIRIFLRDSLSFLELSISSGNIRSSTIPTFETTTIYRQHPDLSDITLVCTGKPSVYVFSTEKLTKNSKTFGDSISFLSFDPLNTMNCLIVGKNPTWTVFSFLPDFNIISTSGNNSITASSGDWIPALPGQIVTGSDVHGILHIWTISDGQVTDSIQLEDAPVNSLQTISDKNVIVTFQSGVFGIVDVTKRSYVFKLNNAHKLTIFSCNFLPTDPSVLATSGADGQICLWSLPQLEIKNRIQIENIGSLLTSCFSPGGGYLAVGSVKGFVMIYDMKTFEQVYSQQLHQDHCVSIAWSPHDPDIICTAGGDKQCHFFNIKERKIVTTISVNNTFRNIQWSRTEKSIAVACFDGSIYVRMDGGAYLIIKGNGEAPLFDVAWSPFHPTWIAATDDKGGVLLFDTADQTCKRAVKHRDRARPVLWSEAIDYLFISGGYDGNIILWDARTLSSLGVINAHSSHVYGLATHPQTPYLFVSTSKDEMIRIWSFDRMFPSEKVHALIKGDRFEAEKFCPFDGTNDLVKLIHRVLHDGTRQSFNDGDLCHINDIIRLTKKRISKMTSALPHDQSVLMRAKKARKAAIQAADLCLKSGDVKRYCELMFMAGEYNIALSAAPAVSYTFWQNLMIERAAMLKGSEDAAELTLVAGKPLEAIEEFLDLNRYDNAMLITAALRETDFLPRTKSAKVKPKSNETDSEAAPFIRTNFDSANDYGPYIVASRRSLQYAKEGKPLFSAAALLTVGDVSGAAWRLLHCGELMWAMEIARLLDEVDENINDIFARYCIKHNCESEIFPLLSPKLKRKLAPFVAFDSDESRDKFYKEYRMKSVAEYYEEAKRSRGAAKVQFLLLCGRQTEAAMLAVQLLRAILAQGPYDYSEAQNIVQLISNIYVPPSSQSDPIWNEAIALCFYFAVYQAMWRGYDSIIERLVASTEAIITKCNFEYLKPKVPEMKIAAALALAKYNSSFGIAYINDVSLSNNAFEGIKKLDADQSFDGGSTVHALGTGNLPINVESDPIVSICSGLKIDGNIFFLEDGKSAMSMEEALMWFEVTPFSPLDTHERLFPY